MFYETAHEETLYDEEILLSLRASYSHHITKESSNQFIVGDGVIGQCGLERKSIILSNIPDGYLLVKSGAGSATLKTIIVFPILFEGNLLGVLEISSFTNFNTLQLALIEQLQENIGVVINNIRSRIRTEELLCHSQEQSREMQHQQESLQAVNLSLEQQTEQLKNQKSDLNYRAKNYLFLTLVVFSVKTLFK